MFLAKKYFSRKERRTYSISVLLKSHWRFSPSNPSLLSYTLVLLPTAQYKEPFSVAPPSPLLPQGYREREKRKKQLLPPLPFSFSSFGRTIRRRRRKSVHFLLSAPARTLFPRKNEGDFFPLCPEETSSYTGRENFLLLTNRERERQGCWADNGMVGGGKSWMNGGAKMCGRRRKKHPLSSQTKEVN